MHFWKHVPSFRKNYKNPIEPKTDVNRLTHPRQAAEAFGAYFQSAFNNHTERDFSTDFQSSDSLSAASVCDSDVFKSIRRVRPSKSVGLDDIPAFIIQGCSDILIPVLTFIFKISFSQRTFPTLWKKMPLYSFSKKERLSSVIIADQPLYSVPFPKYFKFIIHENAPHHLKPDSTPVSLDSSKLILHLQILLLICTSLLDWFIPSIRFMPFISILAKLSI